MRANAFRVFASISLAACCALQGCAASETSPLAATDEDDGSQGGSGNNAGEPATGGTSGSDTGGTGGTSSGSGGQGGSGATATGGATSGGTSNGGTSNPTGGTAGTMVTPPGRPTIPLPYTDDFESGEAPDWRFISVPWTVVDDGDGNHVLQLSASGDSETTWAIGGDRNWTDVRVEMRVKFVSGDAMILLSPRWQNLDSYAFVEYEAEDKPKLRSRVNGSTTDLIAAADTMTFALGMWHTVVVTIVGSSTTLDIDGTPIGMNASSTLAPSGGIGIAAENGVIAIDDVSVTAP